MLPDRYRVRVKTAEGIEAHSFRFSADARKKFTEIVGWVDGAYVGSDESHLAVQLEDSGRERGEFKPVTWCDLKKQNAGITIR